MTGDDERLQREPELPHPERGGRTVVPHGEIDAGIARRILGRPAGRPNVYHAKSAPGTREIFPGGR